MIANQRLVFVGGLHRSGTTPFAHALAAHPAISGLADTGVAEDEGEHLQRVYPRIRRYGGMGRFARDPRMHLTESSRLVTMRNGERLLRSWAPYWDLSCPLLVEKSPANMLRGRFLQALFPGSALIVVVRHPVTVALALEKWNPRVVARNGRRRTTLLGRIENWVHAYETFLADAAHLERVHLVRYEDLVRGPARELAPVAGLLGLRSPIPADSLQDRGDTYAERWSSYAHGRPIERRIHRVVGERYAEPMLRLGYRPDDLRAVDAWELQSGATG